MKYLKYLLSIILIVVIFFEGMAFIGDIFCDAIDNKYSELGYLTPATKGSAMGIDYIYSFDLKLNDKMTILGASTSIIGLDEDETFSYLGNEYSIEKICCGSADIFSMYILKNYVELKGAKLGLVKVDISPILFKTSSIKNEVVTSALTFGDVYKVNKDLTVEKTFLYDVKEFFIKDVRSIQRFVEYIKSFILNGSYEVIYETSDLDWESYFDLLSFDTYRAELIEGFILDNSNVIVDILYESDSLKDSITGQYYNRYIDEMLIPFLEDNEIRYIDSRDSVSNENFVDGIHINKQGQKEYTEYVKAVLGEY